MIKLSAKISDYIKSVFGYEFLDKYIEFIENKYPMSVRLQNDKTNRAQLLKSLTKQGIELRKINEIPNAYSVVKGEDIIGKTVEHTLGKYYIQSLSSMIPPLVLNPQKHDVVMDLCAAPGSKSTLLAEMMLFKGTLFCNEPKLNRIKSLVHNLDKMNAVNICVIKEKGELLSKRFPNYFDKILVDAPCSALGVVQKKQEVSNWWDSDTANRISALQLKLLISAVKMTKVGGEIVYSTCTLTIEENEFIIDKIIKKYPVELVEFKLDIESTNGFTEINNYSFDKSLSLTKRIIPWQIKSEGFFVAKLRKVSETEIILSKTKKVNSNKIIVNFDDKRIKKYINDIAIQFGIPINILKLYKYILNEKDINFVNVDSKVVDPIYFVRVGTKFGLIDKKNNCKLHSHSAQILGSYANKNIFNIENEDELKTYFSGGVIHRKNSVLGQKIAKYNNLYLGTGVALDNQFKSQFPRSKRSGNITIT